MKIFLALTLGLLISNPANSQDQEPSDNPEEVNCLLETAANWDEAEPVTVIMRDFDTKPEHIQLKACTPYVMTVKNVGKKKHNFIAEKFFQSVLLMDPNTRSAVRPSPTFKGTGAAPRGGETSLTFFVAATGTFKYECTHFGHAALGMKGKITVEP
jgi:plastocyanin